MSCVFEGSFNVRLPKTLRSPNFNASSFASIKNENSADLREEICLMMIAVDWRVIEGFDKSNLRWRLVMMNEEGTVTGTDVIPVLVACVENEKAAEIKSRKASETICDV